MSVHSETIRELRERRDLGVGELARMTELSKSFISQIESGRRKPSKATIRKLARALRVSPEDLGHKRLSSAEELMQTLQRISHIH